MNTQLSPTVSFQNRVTNIFFQMVQQLATTGQITEPVRQFMVAEFNANMNNIVHMIFGKFVYGGCVREASDGEIQTHLNNLINQMIRNYQIKSQQQQVAIYSNPNVVGYPQPQRYYVPQPNPGFVNGGVNSQMTGGLIQTTGVPSTTVTPVVCDANDTPIQSDKTSQATVQTPFGTTTEGINMQEDTIYNPPVLADNSAAGRSGVAIDNGWENGTIVTYKDVDTRLEISYVTMNLHCGVRTPLVALETVMRSLRGCLSKDQYVVVTYPQLKPYDLPRDEFQAAIKALKEISLPHNAKYTYLKNIRKALGSFNTSTYETVESFLISEFNAAAMHGSLFTSDWNPSDLSFSVKTLRELIGYLDPEDADDLPDYLKQIPGFKDRLSEVARHTIGTALSNMELSDPNTPDGLDDYITVVGDVVVGEYCVKDIKVLKERAMRTNKSGEKTPEAVAAEKAYNKIFGELMKYSIVKLCDKTVIYTNLPVNGMIVDYAGKGPGDLPYINRRSQCIAGPGRMDNHVEFFTSLMTDESPVGLFHIYFRIVPSVLMAYTGAKTTDEWYYLLPTAVSF